MDVTDNAIYKMKIHETLTHQDGFKVMRVHKGWIYTFYDEVYNDPLNQYRSHSVFVPKD